MKPFIIWLVIAMAVFGGIGGGYHAALTGNPRKVLVAVDSSFQMKAAWTRVPAMLDSLDNDRYTVYSLVTEKNVVHSWQATLNLETMTPYAPLELSKLTGPAQYPEITQADRKYFLTTDQSLTSNPEFSSWTILQLTP